MTDLKAVKAIKNSQPLRIVDVIVMIAIVAAALTLALTGALDGKPGARVKIADNGKTQEYPISENRTIELPSITVVIENGEVYVTDSTCPDKICEHSGKISRVNQSIVCLPAGIVITITGAGEFQTDTGQEK